MNFQEYQKASKEAGYREQLTYIVASEPSLRSFLAYEEADLQVKTHLAKVIICRHFYSTGGIALPEDVRWFIDCFLSEFKTDLIKPWISGAVKESMTMIASEATFTKVIIGMTFMFGVVEFYAKYRLGWRPELYDHFDKKNQGMYRDMTLGSAIYKLKKTECALAEDLKAIDMYNISSLKKSGIDERGFTKSRIADRLTLARNCMIHGEAHYFYYMGEYLVMLYILFHFHGLTDGFKYEGI